jgi:tRNA (guanine-N7-)-methyltransferase
VRSFVSREGRLTSGQRTALDELYPRFGVAPGGTIIDFSALFGREAPRWVDIGFGAGETLLWHAERAPAVDFLGIEVYPPGVGRALQAIAARGLANVRVLRQDAVEVFEQRLAPRSIDRVMLLFPDPWPKKRHHKRRIVQPAFLTLLAQALKPGGILHMATDWMPYAEVMAEVGDAHPAFERIVDPVALAEATLRPPTRFERRGERLGHEVRDLAWRRRAAPQAHERPSVPAPSRAGDRFN